MFVCFKCNQEKDEALEPIQINPDGGWCWDCIERAHDEEQADMAADHGYWICR